MNGKLVAVIVTFNRMDKLPETVHHTLAQNFHRIIVVNNCSTDSTAQWLDGLDDNRLVIIHSVSNQGGAGGFHQGFRYAAQEIPEAEWLVCFDDDAYPKAGVVENFDLLNIPDDVGSLAAAVYLPDGRISEMNRPSMNPFWHLKQLFGAASKGRQGFHVDDSSYEGTTTEEVDASSFVGCFIRLSLIREMKIGLPRAELFIYADDIIYLLELRRAGFRHLFVPSITFVHDCQTLINQRDVYHPLWKVYYTFRNRLETYRIAAGVFYPLVLLIKVPQFFLTFRHYEQHERKLFLRIAATAVWDGILRIYTKTHAQVVELSTLKA